MPDLLRYQLVDGPHAGQPTTERGEIERLARECRIAACQAGLDSAVIETRFNVVRSLVPDVIMTVRMLRDYLPPRDHRDPPTQADIFLGEIVTTVAARSRGADGPSPDPGPR